MQPVVVTCDAFGVVRSWSESGRSVLGIDAKDIIGTHFSGMFAAVGNLILAKEIMVRTLHQGQQWEGEFPFVGRDGRRVPGHLTVTPILDRTADVAGTVATFTPLPAGSADQGFASYLVEERGLAMSTAYTYEHSIATLEKWLGKERTQIQVGDMRRFLREADYHPSTKNGVLRALKSYRKFGAIEGWWDMGPIVALSGPKVRHDPKPALTAEEARIVLGACRRSNDFRLVALGLYGGLRVSESAALLRENWLPDRIRVHKGKGGKSREFPVHAMLPVMREAVLQRPSTSAESLKHVCRSLSHVTGIPFTSHTLRRTFSQRLAELGGRREVIGKILGHAALSVTETYAPVTWAEMVSAIGLLTY